jgi:very-short-patch-repair endonuclease
MNWTDIATRQGGVVARRQLRELGHSDHSIDGLVYRGRLEGTASAGVYRVSGAPATFEARRWCAVLATRSPLSYMSAAQLWQVAVPDDGKLHITRFDRRRLVWPPGVRLHRVALEREAVTTQAGLLVTSRVETLLDCLGWLPIQDARNLADRAQQQRWLGPADIERRLNDQPGRWGNRQLRMLCLSLGDGAHSAAERRLHLLLRSAAISGWTANLAVSVAGELYVVDVAFRRQLVAIEVDGYGPHSSRDAFQRDRTKQSRLIVAGWTVIRFTWADLMDRPAYVIATIQSVLAR